MQTFPKGNPLRVVWRLIKPDFTQIDLSTYDLKLKVSTARGAKYVDFEVKDNAVIWICEADRQFSVGAQDLELQVYRGSELLGRVCYPDAFGLAKQNHRTSPVIHEKEAPGILSLVSIADFMSVQPVIPTIGEDGCWWVNGVSTGFKATGDIKILPDGTIILNPGSKGQTVYAGIKDIAAMLNDRFTRLQPLVNLGIAMDTTNNILTIGGKRYLLTEYTGDIPQPGPDDDPQPSEGATIYVGEIDCKKSEFTQKTASELLMIAEAMPLSGNDSLQLEIAATHSCIYLLLPVGVQMTEAFYVSGGIKSDILALGDWIEHENVMVGDQEYVVYGNRGLASQADPLSYTFRIN